MAGYEEGELSVSENMCLMKRVDPKSIDQMIGEHRHEEIRREVGLPSRTNSANINKCGVQREVIYRLCVTSKQRDIGQRVIDWTEDYLNLLR